MSVRVLEQQSTTSVSTAPPVGDGTGGVLGVAAALLLLAIVVAAVVGFARSVARTRSARRRGRHRRTTVGR